MPQVEFLKKARWADPDEPRPRTVHDSSEGNRYEVSEQGAKNLLAAGVAKLVEELAPAPVQKAESKAPASKKAGSKKAPGKKFLSRK